MKRNTRKFRLVLTSLVLVAAILVLAAGAALADYWPMFNRDLLNTGVADPALAGITVPIEMWSYTTDNGYGSGSPVIADIDGDGYPEVLVPTASAYPSYTGGVYALNSDGTLRWKYQAGDSDTGDYGTYATPPLADIDGDGKLETVFPSLKGKIIAVDENGTQMWVVDKGSGGTRSVIADVTGDAGLEVVVGAASKTFLLKASDGTQIWEAPYRMLCDPAIADLDGDGNLEVVFSATGRFIVALNAEDGTLWWTSALMGQDAQNNLSIISDINSDGYPDVVAGSRDKKLYVFSGLNGWKLWDYSLVGRSFSAAVADFNGDGYDDVVTTATKSDGVESYVYLLDVKNKMLLWQHNVFGAKYHSTAPGPALADVNGDGTLDVIVDNGNRVLYALSGIDGSEIWTIARTAGGQDASSPAIGDLDGDGGMEIVVSAGNSVQVFTQEPPPIVPMSEFQIDHAKIDFKKKPDDDKVRVKGKLDPASDVDIDDDVTVTVGPLSETIPMVEKGKKGDKWEYKRPKGGTGDIKHMTINWKNGEFDIRMDKADLTGVTNPVTISIQIGDDVGSKSILMREKKHHWDYKAEKTGPAAIEPLVTTDEAKVVAYPNPIRDVDTATFQVKGTLATQVEEIRVQIYDLSGRLVWEDAALGSELDWHTDCLSGDYLANGIYLYRVQLRIDGSWISQDLGKIAVLR